MSAQLDALLQHATPDGRFAYEVACAAIEQGVDGTLIIRVPGLPDLPPEITWVSGDRQLQVEGTVVPCSHNCS